LSSKLLVVEDNQDTRELIHHYFINAEFTVTTAVDGSEGIYMAKAEKPDLIITDLAMPNLDGMEMIKKLRDDPETATIPIIVFTAHGSVTPEEATEAGADRVFYKPFVFDELVRIVRVLIHQ
jgi:DNA-binding response OmpR family regulator